MKLRVSQLKLGGFKILIDFDAFILRGNEESDFSFLVDSSHKKAFGCLLDALSIRQAFSDISCIL